MKCIINACRPQVAAQQLGSSPERLYRWQQAPLIAEVGSVAVARDPEVRQLRAQLKRAEQELDSFKKSLGLPNAVAAFSASRPGEHLPLPRPAPSTSARAPALPDVARVS